MGNNQKPNIKISLPRNIFNSFFSSLSYFSEAVDVKEKNYFKKTSTRLKEKILKHGRAFSNKDGDYVSVFLYDIEASALIVLMANYINLGEEPFTDYFSLVKNVLQKNNKNENKINWKIGKNEK